MCGCLRERVSANVGWCGVLWLLSFLCVWYVFGNVSCTYSDVLYMSILIPDSICVGVTLWFGRGGVVSGCRLKHYWSVHVEQ